MQEIEKASYYVPLTLVTRYETMFPIGLFNLVRNYLYLITTLLNIATVELRTIQHIQRTHVSRRRDIDIGFHLLDFHKSSS